VHSLATSQGNAQMPQTRIAFGIGTKPAIHPLMTIVTYSNRLLLCLLSTMAPSGGCLEGGKRIVGPGEPDTTTADTTTADTTDAVIVIAPGTPDADEVIASLDGLRWELPCLAYVAENVCSTLPQVVEGTAVSGDPDTIYTVTLRFRGVVEEKTYVGGSSDGMIQRGGSPIDGDWNVYALDISQPPQTLYLNRGTSGNFHCVALDATAEVQVRGGARITLRSEVFDAQQIPNLDVGSNPIAAPGVPPYPAVYDGQFIQMDVVAIRD
jgi:hypothetical protein